MKSKRRVWLVLIALLVIIDTSVRATKRGPQKPQKLAFEMVYCGIALLQSHQGYRVSDGTSLTVDHVTYSTIGKAKKAFNKELKGVRRIDERKNQLDETGKRIGERIVAIVSGYDGTERALLLSLENKTLYKIEAASLRHILEFQESERTSQALPADSRVTDVLALLKP